MQRLFYKISAQNIFILLSFQSMILVAQTTTNVVGGFDINRDSKLQEIEDGTRPVQTAVPFLSITPNARAAAMGDQGVATSADENSAYWNPGKLCRVEKDFGGSISYNPWLRALVNDMSLSNVSGYYRLRKEDVIGVNFTYFDLGNINFTDVNGQPIRDYRPQELSFGGTYSRMLSKKFSGGITLKYIYSNLSGNITNTAESQITPGQTGAADIGFYYNTDLFALDRDMHLTVGAMISNIGGKISYGNNNRADFIPTMLRLGAVHSTELDPYNKLNFGFEAAKLMTPSSVIEDVYIKDRNGVDSAYRTSYLRTPSKTLLSGMLGSFSDAPFGPREELQEITLSSSAEYWYDNLFAVRAGYFYENPVKGNRQYISMGFGIKYKTIGLDFAYLLPVERNNPLANTVRFTLCLNFEKPKQQEQESVVE